uniref:C3H1-type domain-containing protein n=1 Tax=Salix viminalis TaxID=40686 RepID=A0A6N2LCJ3_SALVM
MMITKFLIAFLFFSLLVLQLAEADRDTIVVALARRGASYHPGLACAIEHVGPAVQDAAVFLPEQPTVLRLVLRGASCRRGQTCATEHAVPAVLVAAAFLRALLGTMMRVPATAT